MGLICHYRFFGPKRGAAPQVPICPLQFMWPLFLQRQCHQIPYRTSSHPMLPQHLHKELDTLYTTSLRNGQWTPPWQSQTHHGQCQTKTREPLQTNPQAIQQTTKGHHSILDSILPLPPYHHQKDQEIPSIQIVSFVGLPCIKQPWCL